MKKLARFWEKLFDQKVQCTLCPWNCVIPPDKVGFCKARKNENGELYTLIHGSVVSMAVDPIEKKPFYHFWPGSSSFSIATAGCNFRCSFCQNCSISQVSIDEVAHQELPPERAVELAKHHNCKSISFTYTEPSIWWEYCYDVSKLAHQKKLYTNYVTNGYMSLEPLEEIRPYLDAANVDVKAFSDRFYRKLLGVAGIKPVLDTCEWMVKHGIHLEITYLVIPQENDSNEEIRDFCKWAVDRLGPDVPVHFSRFYPHYKMLDREPTPVKTLERALKTARNEGLNYVYIGNVPGHSNDNTHCPKCDELLIERYGFAIEQYKLKNKRCPNCGLEIKIVGEYE